MMPELGKYGAWVLGSYGLSLALIAVLVAVSLWRADRVRRSLREVEERQGRQNG
jgi:heme exporter protein D